MNLKNKILSFVQICQKSKEVPFMEISRHEDQKRKETLHMEMPHDNNQKKA